MNDIAFFFGDKFIYWHGIIMTLAVAVTVLCAAGLRVMQKGDIKGFAAATALAVPAALLFSRFVYGFFALEAFRDIPGIMLSGDGGNSLPGAAIGVVLTVLVSKRLGWLDSVADMLDCLAPAAALGLCVGRLSAVFGRDDRGMEIPPEATDSFITCLDESSGQQVLAVYAYESIFAALLFGATLLLFLRRWHSADGRRRVLSGDTALMFLAGFGASQGVLESMRTDSLTVIGLGFVRVLQIIALVCLMVPIAVFSIRAVKKRGITLLQLTCWVAVIGLLALAVYMEFTMSADFEVQLRNYSAMANCMIGLQVLTAWQYSASRDDDLHTRRSARSARPTVQNYW